MIQLQAIHRWVDGNCRAAAGRHFHHAAVAIIPDEQIASLVHRQALGHKQSFAIHHWVNGSRRAPAGRNLHHAVVVKIRNEQIAHPVHRQAGGIIQPYGIQRRGTHRRGDGNRRAPAGGNLDHAIVKGVRDEQIARPVHRQERGIVQSFAIHRRGDGNRCAAAGGNLDHAIVKGVRDEQIARPVHRQVRGIVQSFAIHRRGDGNGRAGTIRDLRPGSNSIDGHIGQHRPRVVGPGKEDHRAHAQPRRLGRESHVHCAVGGRGVGLRRAGAPRRIAKVQVRRALGQHSNAAHRRAGGDGEVQRFRRAGRTDGLRAKVHARRSPGKAHLRPRSRGQQQAGEKNHQQGKTQTQGLELAGKQRNGGHHNGTSLGGAWLEITEGACEE